MHINHALLRKWSPTPTVRGVYKHTQHKSFSVGHLMGANKKWYSIVSTITSSRNLPFIPKR